MSFSLLKGFYKKSLVYLDKMDFQKIHHSAPLRNHSCIKNCMIRLAQITFLIKCINQTDKKENLLPEDTAYAMNFQPGVSHALFHFSSFSFLSLWLLLSFQNTCSTYHDFLYLSKSTPSLFPGHLHIQTPIYVKITQIVHASIFYTS